MSSKKQTTRRIKNSQHVFLPANCAEISKVTSDGGNWILGDLGPPRLCIQPLFGDEPTFSPRENTASSPNSGWIPSLGTSRSESVRSKIQLLYSFMKYDHEKLISPSLREFYKLSVDI